MTTQRNSYTFKEGLTMMAAKAVGIDPYLAAEGGESARAAINAIRNAAKTKAPKERAGFIREAQNELRSLSAAQHPKLVNALQAKVLALQGRGGDTAVAHVEPGEMVLPRAMLTPELMHKIATEAAKRGIDPRKLLVGKASINPVTGVEEHGVGFGDWLKHTGDTVPSWEDNRAKEPELDLSDITKPISVSHRDEKLPDPWEKPAFVLGRSVPNADDPNPWNSRTRNSFPKDENGQAHPGQETYETANRYRLEAHVTPDNWQERKPWLDEMTAYSQLPDGSEAKRKYAEDIIDRSWTSGKEYDPFQVSLRKQLEANSQDSGQNLWLTNRDTHEKLFQKADADTRSTGWGELVKGVAGTAVALAPFAPPAARLAGAAEAVNNIVIEPLGAGLANIRRGELQRSFEEKYRDLPRSGRR